MAPGPVSRTAASLAVSCLCAAAIALPSPSAAAAAAAAKDPQGASVVAYSSTARPFTETLVLRGRTEADRRVELRSEISGLIASEPLRKGAEVETGDILCELAEGDRAAEMAEARARLAEARLNAEAADRLSEKGYTSAAEANSMAASLEQARAQVLRAEINLERLRITAPFDGVLETDAAELGSLLQAGSICATLIALDPIKLVAYAPESSVESLRTGATVTARLITGREVEAVVTFVSRAAERETRTYLVEAEAKNADRAIRDGMSAEMSVKLQGRPAHLVPQSALTLDDDGELGVRLAVEGRARFTPVEVLRDETVGVWVDGLPERADIIVVGQEFVADGQPLRVEFADPAQLR